MGIPFDGSQWIVQVQPTEKRHLIAIEIPLDGSQWIVQVQPTEKRNLITMGIPLDGARGRRLDLNDPLTAVEWDSRI
jgi:hypothetical protein